MSANTTLSMENMLKTYGVMLFGGSVAFGLSGIVCLQCVIYFKYFRSDPRFMRLTVIAVWLFDILHSCLILTSLFFYFIKYFGMYNYINHIPWPLALTVIVTAIQTFIVHCSFSYKIFKASKRSYKIVVPIVLFSLFRLVTAAVSTGEMLRLGRFSAFSERHPGWIFTLGLVLSFVTDLMVTFWRCYFLRTPKESILGDSTLMMRVVDFLTLYTLENGLLLCVVSMSSLTCWLAMPQNLIFLGLHFIIGKLYANSLLATLNVREELRQIQIGFGKASLNDHTFKTRAPGYMGYRPGPLYTIKEVTTEEFTEDSRDSNSDDHSEHIATTARPSLPPVTYVYSNQRHDPSVTSAAFLHLSAVAPHASARSTR